MMLTYTEPPIRDYTGVTIDGAPIDLASLKVAGAICWPTDARTGEKPCPFYTIGEPKRELWQVHGLEKYLVHGFVANHKKHPFDANGVLDLCETSLQEGSVWEPYCGFTHGFCIHPPDWDSAVLFDPVLPFDGKRHLIAIYKDDVNKVPVKALCSVKDTHLGREEFLNVFSIVYEPLRVVRKLYDEQMEKSLESLFPLDEPARSRAIKNLNWYDRYGSQDQMREHLTFIQEQSLVYLCLFTRDFTRNQPPRTVRESLELWVSHCDQKLLTPAEAYEQMATCISPPTPEEPLSLEHPLAEVYITHALNSIIKKFRTVRGQKLANDLQETIERRLNEDELAINLSSE